MEDIERRRFGQRRDGYSRVKNGFDTVTGRKDRREIGDGI